MLPKTTEGHVQFERSVSRDGVLDLVDFGFKFPQALRQAGDVARRLDGINQFCPALFLVLQILHQCFHGHDRSLVFHRRDPLPKFVFTLLDDTVQNSRTQDALLDRIDQLLLESILSDQELVVTLAVVFVLMASVLDVPALAAPGTDHHAAAALATNQVATEQVRTPALVVAGAAVLVKRGPRFSTAGLNTEPKRFRNDSPIRDLDTPPLRVGSDPAHLSTCFGISGLLRPTPHVHAAVALIPQHLVNRVSRPRTVRTRNVLGVQLHRNRAQAVPRGVHLENARDNRSFLVVDLKLHTEDGGPSILSLAGGVLDGHVVVPVDAASGRIPVERTALLAAVDLLGEIGQVLLVHDAVHGKQGPGVALRRVDPLAYRDHRDTAELQDLEGAKGIREVASEPGGVINQKAVEDTILCLRRLHQRLQAFTPCHGSRGQCPICDNEFFND